MNQQHSTAETITVSKGKPYRATLKLWDYFKVADGELFKAGGYQVNVKFYASGLKMTGPIDSGASLFEMAPKK